jgi:hypothetical protein
MTLEKPSSDMGISADYVMTLEKRIIQLENQIQEVQKKLSEQKTTITEIDKDLPVTNLLSNKFLTRAFAVWGHVFVAQLIIALIFYGLVFVLAILRGGS